MNKPATFAVGAVLLLAGAVAVAQSAQGDTTPDSPSDSEPSKPELTPIAKQLHVVRGMLTNAQAKFNRKAVGIDSRSANVPQTPARMCCSGNLQHIETAIKNMRQLVRERGVCLERRRDREGVEIVNLVNQDLRSLDNAVKLFAESTVPADTQRALYGCTRAFLNLKSSSESLKDCSAGQ